MALKWDEGFGESLSRAPFDVASIVSSMLANVVSRAMIEPASIACACVRECSQRSYGGGVDFLFACNQ
jgi:hypothetical protein